MVKRLDSFGPWRVCSKSLGFIFCLQRTQWKILTSGGQDHTRCPSSTLAGTYRLLRVGFCNFKILISNTGWEFSATPTTSIQAKGSVYNENCLLVLHYISALKESSESHFDTQLGWYSLPWLKKIKWQKLIN